eukprot:Protomagalhaensia_sp_Gyna_25__5600@NODE_773_length_2646_cov_832_530495_g606_i0_p3_GENE_NODE_773_length_2646_cov_832_530495_g606_i0NODE_773_length_2646_cov_832_530495_g606_i0_p3_ORF_typecomplete_len204_score26_43Fra10Ac1/PF09725_9/5_5e39_NODE_773_length_2646_cov_832_530495_g606_i0161772
MFKKDIISGSALNFASKEQRDRALGTAALAQSRFDRYPGRVADPLAITRLKTHQRLLESIEDKEAPVYEDDFALLRRHLQFLYDDDEEALMELGTSGHRLALAYYKRLHKEYVLVDLSRYTTGQVGMRWRTESELTRGKGQFECGAVDCPRRHCLKSYELHFQYAEGGTEKEALVKARLCSKCAKRMMLARSALTGMHPEKNL